MFETTLFLSLLIFSLLFPFHRSTKPCRQIKIKGKICLVLGNDLILWSAVFSTVFFYIFLFYTPFFLFYCKQFTYKYIFFYFFSPLLPEMINESKKKNMKLLCRENIVCTGESHGCDITFMFHMNSQAFAHQHGNFYCIFRIFTLKELLTFFSFF